MNDKAIKEMVYTSLFAALICVATFSIRVPSVVTNGYTHLGDGFIFIAVTLLGKRNGAWAGAIGASLADIIGGYSFYALPTFIIKFVMGYVMGTVIEKLPEIKNRRTIGAAIGSIWQIFAYYVVGSLMVGNFFSTLADIPGNTIQSIAGMLVAVAFTEVFRHTSVGKNILEC